MDEKNRKKLSLNRETLRNLSDESLEQVAGGKGGKSGGPTLFVIGGINVCVESVSVQILGHNQKCC
jgi:hypothetical protein